MQSSEFGRIEKATRAFEIECRKITHLLVSKSEGGLLLRRTERAVHRRNAPEWSGDAQSGLSDGVDYQTRFVTVFRGRPPTYYLERLNCVDRKLCGEGFALLVVDRLVIQRY